MTRHVKIYITLLSVILIAVLASSAIYFSMLNERTNRMAANYNARREELLLQQQSLQERISQLNYTLAVEASKNEELKRRVEALTNQTITQANTPPPPKPQPVPITPIITTRAS